MTGGRGGEGPKEVLVGRAGRREHSRTRNPTARWRSANYLRMRLVQSSWVRLVQEYGPVLHHGKRIWIFISRQWIGFFFVKSAADFFSEIVLHQIGNRYGIVLRTLRLKNKTCSENILYHISGDEFPGTEPVQA